MPRGRPMGGGGREFQSERQMGALVTGVAVLVGCIVSWFAVKPLLDAVRASVDKSLNKDIDPDDNLPGGPGSQDKAAESEAPKALDSEAPQASDSEAAQAEDSEAPQAEDSEAPKAE